ncbi:hypothetical protein D3C87_2002210 [compost metagenome]
MDIGVRVRKRIEEFFFMLKMCCCPSCEFFDDCSKLRLCRLCLMTLVQLVHDIDELFVLVVHRIHVSSQTYRVPFKE